MNDSPSSFRKKVHIPFMDIDDLPYNRQDPKYVASISKKIHYFKLYTIILNPVYIHTVEVYLKEFNLIYNVSIFHQKLI